MIRESDIGGRRLCKWWEKYLEQINKGERPDIGDGEIQYFERWLNRYHPEMRYWNTCPENGNAKWYFNN